MSIKIASPQKTKDQTQEQINRDFYQTLINLIAQVDALPAVSGVVSADSIWNAKGDLAVGTGPDTATILSVGADTFVLTADSTTATGLKWVAAGGVTDGDKGDITVSSSGTVYTIDADAVTYAKMQNVSATDKILGRASLGSGDVEEITCTSAGRALIDDADAAAQRTTLGLGTLSTQNGTFSGTSSGTNTGDQTSIVGITGTKAEFNAAVTDGDFLYVGDVVSNVPTSLSIGTQTGTTLAITSDGAADDVILPEAVPSGNAGLLSGADKAKLDGISGSGLSFGQTMAMISLGV